MTDKALTDAEKLDRLFDFLQRVNGYGYLELSHMKVEGEYRYFHQKAGELMHELYPERFVDPPAPDQPLSDDF